VNRVHTSLLERFEAKIQPEPNSGCWLWDSSLTGGGYGTIGLGTRAQGKELAHRVSWELFRGEIADGLWVLHKCDVRCCVNPDHLFLGTHSDNMRDCVAKNRHRWAVAA
jgi:hypothetical protein